MSTPLFISFKHKFPKLYTVIPGIMPGTYYCVTGQTGSGKTKFWKNVFIVFLANYCRENNLPFEANIFLMEESKEKFFITILLAELYDKYGIELSYYEYKGYYGELDSNLKSKIDELEENYMPYFREHFKIYDNIANPTGIYKTVRENLSKIGTKSAVSEFTDEEGNNVETFDYKFNQENQIFIVGLDHVSLITGEKNRFTKNGFLTPHEAMTKVSRDFLMFTKKCNIITAVVHQQQMSGDNVDNMKFNNIEPSMTKLADNAIIGRDYQIVFGVFEPQRYNLLKYNGMDIKAYGNNMRAISIIKHRDGEGNISLNMSFNGKTNDFKEL